MLSCTLMPILVINIIMKKLSIFLGLLLIITLSSCKKEKFDLGIYEIQFEWTENDEEKSGFSRG